jgi:hypothetical protein
MTGVELAAKLDVPNATLSTSERGTTPTRPDPFEVCTRLEKILGLPKEWFAWGEMPEKATQINSSLAAAGS